MLRCFYLREGNFSEGREKCLDFMQNELLDVVPVFLCIEYLIDGVDVSFFNLCIVMMLHS